MVLLHLIPKLYHSHKMSLSLTFLNLNRLNLNLLNLYGIYSVILPLGISWAFMKYHIKPLGKTKTKDFRQEFYRYDLFLYL